MILVILLFSGLAFVLSASAGLGGSLILVPGLSLLLGAKAGIALSAILLAGNNVAKVVVYRKTLALRAALPILLLTVVGAVLGAGLLVKAPERWIEAAILLSILATFLLERREHPFLARASAPLLAFCSGATSGFSGTSGPLKGLAIRSLGLDRLQFVGAASVVSLAGDATKAVVLVPAVLVAGEHALVGVLAIPLMVLASLAGRHVNSRIGERAYSGLFWTVMGGYALRLVAS